jgi:hypothetical protein
VEQSHGGALKGTTPAVAVRIKKRIDELQEGNLRSVKGERHRYVISVRARGAGGAFW